ncbi:hypothetical protein RDABS01_003547 [Bienertia sinuspersici]
MNHSKFKKRSLEAQQDIISDLPRDVLYKIMVRLPLRDAARMSLLSHKWQDIWTSVPHLTFDELFFMSLKKHVRKTHEYCDIVSKILFQHEGPIFRFSFFVPRLNSSPDIAPWISYLSRNGLKEFSLCNVSTPVKLGSRLFSCGGLEKLKLSGCNFIPPPYFRGFPKLTSLELDGLYLTYSAFKDLVGSCSVLQKLVLTNCKGMEQMHVVIDAPNLRILVLDWEFQSIEVKSYENLVSVSIGLSFTNIHHKASLCSLLTNLANLSKLERLRLSGGFCTVLIKELSLRNTFVRLRNLEFLSLHLYNLDDFSSLISLQTCSVLVLTSMNLDGHLLDFNSECTLHYLRFATIGISSCSSPELKFVEFLLACSPVLEKLSVLPTAPLKQSSHSKMLVQLNRFRRVSPKVEVICPELIIPEPPASSSPSDSFTGNSSNSDSSS